MNMFKEVYSTFSFLRDILVYALPGLFFLLILEYFYSFSFCILSCRLSFCCLDLNFSQISIIIITSYFLGRIANLLSRWSFDDVLLIQFNLNNYNLLRGHVRERALSLVDNDTFLKWTNENKNIDYGFQYLYYQCYQSSQGTNQFRLERFNTISMMYRTVGGLGTLSFLLGVLFLNITFIILGIVIVCLTFFGWIMTENNISKTLIAFSFTKPQN